MADAQDANFKWAKQITANSSAVATSISTDATGNVYTTGFFKGTLDFDPGTAVSNLNSEGNNDVFILKTDAAGFFVWAKSIGGTGIDMSSSISTDAKKGVYITGRFNGTVDFDPGLGSFNLTSLTLQDMFVCKLDVSGNFQWAMRIAELPILCSNFVATDANGNVYINGNFTGTGDFDPGPGSYTLSSYTIPYQDIFVCKLDASRNFIWAKKVIVPNYNYVSDLAVDLNGNVYTTGEFATTADFDPGPEDFSMTSSGIYDSYILKLDTDGNFQWATKLGGPDIEDGLSISVDAIGNVYTTGHFTGTVDFDPGSGIYNLTGSASFYQNTYILKLDASGNFIWAKAFNAAMLSLTDLSVDGAGNAYITGYFFGSLDADPGAGKYILTAAESDIFICKLNAEGDFEWTKQISGAGYENANAIALDGFGNVYTTGEFNGTADFDAGTGTYNLTSSDGTDIYVHKMGWCLNGTTSSLTVTNCNDYTLNDQIYTSSGVYTQTILNNAGCDSIITLNLTITGQLFTTVNKSICNGESYLGHSISGTYIDTFTTVFGCDSIRTLDLKVQIKRLPYLGEDKVLCKGDSIRLYPGEFNIYSWQDGSIQDHLTINQPGLYSVTVMDSCGTKKDEILIKDGVCGIYFPSAFTPNNDGRNDIFKTQVGNNFSEFHLVVYNRWGQKVFESFDPSKGWDGTVDGDLQPLSTFMWYCEFKERVSGYKGSRRGTVTLVR